MKVVIIKYNAGNIRSVDFALKRMGIEAEITADKETILSADKVIFPGVGEAETTMKHLKETGLDQVIKDLKQPTLGICLGMQLMCSHSEEGDVDCLGIFDVPVLKFELPKINSQNLKIPHMGWNTIDLLKGDIYTKDLEGEFVYFVHSFYVPICENTASATNYILPYSSSLQKDNFYATQFHPEKSGSVGRKILENFIAI